MGVIMKRKPRQIVIKDTGDGKTFIVTWFTSKGKEYIERVEKNVIRKIPKI